MMYNVPEFKTNITLSSASIQQHSWYGKHAHVYRSNGKLQRARIGELVVDEKSVLLTMTYTTRGGGDKTKTKTMSPCAVLLLEERWHNNTVVTDDDPDTDDDIGSAEIVSLGPLKLEHGSTDILSKDCTRAVHRALSEVNVLIKKI